MVLWKIYLESSLSTDVHDCKSIWHPPPADEYNHAMPPCQACGILPLAKNSDCPNDHRLLNGTCKDPNIWSHTGRSNCNAAHATVRTTQRICPLTRCVSAHAHRTNHCFDRNDEPLCTIFCVDRNHIIPQADSDLITRFTAKLFGWIRPTAFLIKIQLIFLPLIRTYFQPLHTA